ncbi:trypsin-like peptidase domain-containing protein [Ketobacter sp. MCCC 1A13808]|uniref:S1 family peptidase n=1 Tax=Ketobacter sp. MCCC 1A13808 TaxID=2602738 RepID=UPI000F0DB914|nr:serine protease [Ketobacter sp. MCCC 1A13808]MVF13247.1 trypsin-like peptidase domain-containing protein [Ketobacter sp. MCCC 1A13808]RLP54241.1 MAG: serine protease [Ketobacter sp.]
MPAVESVLLSVARILTFKGDYPLTSATGFFFERESRLYLVTCRHVVVDEKSHHYPDRIELDFHTDPENLVTTTALSILLYHKSDAIWVEAKDSKGVVDIVAIEVDRKALPKSTLYSAFSPTHLQLPEQRVEVGTPLMVVGYPLGFHDWLHHMAVVRHAIVSSSFGLRFQGMGYFMTDARMHRGSSGAPVVMRSRDAGSEALGELPWKLLGVHSARLDVGSRDQREDEALGLNCAWYADILMILTAR